MKNLGQKIEYLNWLNSVGIGYYCSEQKDSKKDLISELKSLNRPIKEMPALDKKENKKTVVMPKKTPQLTSHPAELEARKLADNAKDLKELREAVENFTGCDLKQFASNTVFADGIASAKILLVGEAPGATEDAQGIPFCGESGKLLDSMLSTIGISRAKNAYITNTIFWRPPANRTPTNEEINICKPFVEKHIALIKPKLIILVGGTATTFLLGKNEGISYIRKHNYPYINQYLEEPITTTAIFHPAYLLRQPMQKKTTWFDLLKIQELLKSLNLEL